VQKFLFHIFQDAVFLLRAPRVPTYLKFTSRFNPVNKKMSGIKNCFKRKLYLKIILLGYLFNFYALKTLPYPLLFYGKQGTADFGELRQKNPILPCGLVA